MHPAINREASKARTADLHRRAEQATIARAASRSAPARRGLSWRAMLGHLTGSLAHRTLNHRLRSRPGRFPAAARHRAAS
jgi:hypothetical protein